MSEPTFSIDRIVAALDADWAARRSAMNLAPVETTIALEQRATSLLWIAVPNIRALILSLPELECEKSDIGASLGGMQERFDCGLCPRCLTNETRRRLIK